MTPLTARVDRAWPTRRGAGLDPAHVQQL